MKCGIINACYIHVINAATTLCDQGSEEDFASEGGGIKEGRKEEG